MDDCGLVDWFAVNNIDEEPGGCIGPDKKGFDAVMCKKCEFYPEGAKNTEQQLQPDSDQ